MLAIFSPNHIQYPILYHAVAILGGTFTFVSCVACLSCCVLEQSRPNDGIAIRAGTVCTINPAYTPHEVEYHLKDSGSVYLATLPELVDSVWGVAQQLKLKNVFVFSSAHAAKHAEVVPFATLLELGNPPPRPASLSCHVMIFIAM